MIASRLVSALLAGLFAWPLVAQADALGAAQAREALDQGAQAWDVREAGPATRFLPGASRADLAAWRASGALSDLAQAVSAAGIDLSRDVVVYGHAGDAGAQALVDLLASVATGRVHWFVGGIDEWQAAGLPTAARPAVRRPVPQHLVARPADDASALLAPAAAPRRNSAPLLPGAVVAVRG